MAGKRFVGINGAISSEAICADYESAESFDKIRVGKQGVYSREGFRIRFLSYGDFERVFIRIHEVNGKLCCGKAVFQYFRLVFVRGGKEFADLISENEKAMDQALARIAELSPATAIGFVSKETEA